MPFQPLPDSGPGKPTSLDIGVLLIRLVAVMAFVYYQLWAQLKLGGAYVWEQAEWNLVDRFVELGLPFPNVLAVAFVALLAIAISGLAIGIFTRINSLLMLLATGFILLAPLPLSSSLVPQTLVLYLAVFLGLAIGGGGRVALDYFLAGRKARNRKPF